MKYRYAFAALCFFLSINLTNCKKAPLQHGSFLTDGETKTLLQKLKTTNDPQKVANALEEIANALKGKELDEEQRKAFGNAVSGCLEKMITETRTFKQLENVEGLFHKVSYLTNEKQEKRLGGLIREKKQELAKGLEEVDPKSAVINAIDNASGLEKDRIKGEEEDLKALYDLQNKVIDKHRKIDNSSKSINREEVKRFINDRRIELQKYKSLESDHGKTLYNGVERLLKAIEDKIKGDPLAILIQVQEFADTYTDGILSTGKVKKSDLEGYSSLLGGALHATQDDIVPVLKGNIERAGRMSGQDIRDSKAAAAAAVKNLQKALLIVKINIGRKEPVYSSDIVVYSNGLRKRRTQYLSKDQLKNTRRVKFDVVLSSQTSVGKKLTNNDYYKILAKFLVLAERTHEGPFLALRNKDKNIQQCRLSDEVTCNVTQSTVIKGITASIRSSEERRRDGLTCILENDTLAVKQGLGSVFRKNPPINLNKASSDSLTKALKDLKCFKRGEKVVFKTPQIPEKSTYILGNRSFEYTPMVVGAILMPSFDNHIEEDIVGMTIERLLENEKMIDGRGLGKKKFLQKRKYMEYTVSGKSSATTGFTLMDTGLPKNLKNINLKNLKNSNKFTRPATVHPCYISACQHGNGIESIGTKKLLKAFAKKEKSTNHDSKAVELNCYFFYYIQSSKNANQDIIYVHKQSENLSINIRGN